MDDKKNADEGMPDDISTSKDDTPSEEDFIEDTPSESIPLDKAEPEKAIEAESSSNLDIMPRKTLKDSALVYIGIGIVLLLVAIIFIPRLIHPPQNYTLDELHTLNLQGKLSPDKGYMYKGVYSFVYHDGLWYTQLKTRNSTQLFSIPFHYGPRDVENITLVGYLNYSNLDSYKNFFVTFDPLDTDLNFVAVATAETDQILINVFGKGVIASCIRNETHICNQVPIVECNSTAAPVFFFASEPETNVIYSNNCVVVSGDKQNLFKATDRMLYDLLGIIK
jgi:hypothetical protein